MSKCPTIILLVEFSFITFSPILASLNFFRMTSAWIKLWSLFIFYEGLCCVSFSVNKSVKNSSELSMCFSILELAPWNFWVDEPQEISTDVVALKPTSQLVTIWWPSSVWPPAFSPFRSTRTTHWLECKILHFPKYIFCHFQNQANYFWKIFCRGIFFVSEVVFLITRHF